jgi:hypothetical protein
MNVVPIDMSRNARLAVVLPHEVVREINTYRTERGDQVGRILTQSAALASSVSVWRSGASSKRSRSRDGGYMKGPKEMTNDERKRRLAVAVAALDDLPSIIKGGSDWSNFGACRRSRIRSA